MIAGLFGIALFVVVVAMATLGSVLLALFIMPKTSRNGRIVAAAAGGPGSIVLPFSLFALIDNYQDAIFGVLGMAIFGGFLFVVIGWPVAHFATKRLDRLTQFDLEIFE